MEDALIKAAFFYRMIGRRVIIFRYSGSVVNISKKEVVFSFLYVFILLRCTGIYFLFLQKTKKIINGLQNPRKAVAC
jgi:hypothetical protein